MFIYEFCFFSFDKRMNHRISDSASFLKICRTQASIYYKFQSSLMYYCLPEPNATTVIKITERNKNVVTHNCARCRVETKFSRRKRFLVSCLSYQACTRLRFNCIVTAWQWHGSGKPARNIFSRCLLISGLFFNFRSANFTSPKVL